MEILKQKTSESKYETFWTGDIETTIKTHKLRVICIYQEQKTLTIKKAFKSVIECLDYLVECDYQPKQQRQHIIYFHYGGRFDDNYILDEILTNGNEKNVQELSLMPQGKSSLIVRIKLTYKHIKFQIRDSYPLFLASLNKVATAMISKTKSLNLKEINLDEKTNKQVIEYCLNDCEILYKSLITYQNLLGTPLKLTAASQAFNQFSLNFLDIEWRKLRLKEYNDYRKFGFGGRVDVFKRAGKDIAFLDINTSYSFVMKKWGSPLGTGGSVKKINLANIGFYVIKLKKDYKQKIPFLPYHLDHRLYFFNSKEVEYYVTSHEIELLNQNKMEFELISGYEFERCEDFFNDYVDFWSNKRKENPAMKFLAKNMLNCLSGKFYQHLDFEEIVYDPHNKIKENSLLYDNEHRLKYVKQKQVLTHLNNPQVSSWIWSGGRRLLYEYLQKYKDNIYYSDTDSVVVDKNAIDNNDIHQTQIGKLKIEHYAKKGIFLGSKNYCWIDENNEFNYKVKGFDKYDKEHRLKTGFEYDSEGTKIKRHLLTWNDFEKVLNENDKSNFYTETVRLEGVKTARKTNNYLSFAAIRKELREVINKRKVLKDNINTESFGFKNGQLI